MPTTQQEFLDLADELRLEFADFFIQRRFTVLGEKHPVTGAVITPNINSYIYCFRKDYKASQIDGQMVQANDFMLLVVYSDIPDGFDVRVDGLTVSVDNKTCNVKRVTQDPANATFTLYMKG